MTLSFEQSRHICRIVDVRRGLHAGTVVLVSDGGGQFGYALTCWHNFDPRHQLRISEDTQLDGVFLIPNSDPVTAVEHRRPVIVVAQWSNVHMDVAVLKIPRAVIAEFDLHPMAITFDLRLGMRLRVIGFQRPGHLRRAAGVNVEVVALDHALSVGDWETEVRVFEVTSRDRKVVPFDAGMSGGAMIHGASGALVGFAEAVAPNETGSHRSLAYGVSIETIARGWPVIADYCRVVRAHPWRPWLRRAAIGAAAAAVAAAITIPAPGPPNREKPGCTSSNVGKTPHDAATLSVHRWYGPSGPTGDTGDLTIGKGAVRGGGDRFVYETRGTGPRQGEHAHDPVDPDRPAKFAGVTYLSPSGCWGLTCECGYDLREFRRLRWEARSANGLTPRVEFLIGTDNQTWRPVNGAWQLTPVPYPGSVLTHSFGTYSLSQTWREFDVALEPTQDRSRVIGGFGWLMKWGDNSIEATGASPSEAKTFVIEIRKIRYEK